MLSIAELNIEPTMLPNMLPNISPRVISKVNKSLNLTICKTCSIFCNKGESSCENHIAKNSICTLCSKFNTAEDSKSCQYCQPIEDSTKVRCIVCQRRPCINDKKPYCTDTCKDAAQCRLCDNQVWVDFGENYTSLCLNCMWKESYTTETSDTSYGRSISISLMIRYNNNIFVHKRGKEMKYPGKLSINSGMVDPCDTGSYDTVIREMKEEASIDITTFTNPIIRISVHLFYVELTYNEYMLMRNNINQYKPMSGFEREVDDEGYQFMHDSDIKKLGDKIVLKHLSKSLIVYARYTKYSNRYTRRAPSLIEKLMEICRSVENKSRDNSPLINSLTNSSNSSPLICTDIITETDPPDLAI